MTIQGTIGKKVNLLRNDVNIMMFLSRTNLQIPEKLRAEVKKNHLFIQGKIILEHVF